MRKLRMLMKLSHRLKPILLGLAMLCVATHGSALSLGRAQGAAILGQPLDLAFQVQLGSDEDSASMCFSADVFYGDTRQDANRVVVTLSWVPPSAAATVRVVAYPTVDEPVVTVYLKSECGKVATRRYVLLAEMVTEVAASVVPSASQHAAPPTPESPKALPRPAPVLKKVTSAVREAGKPVIPRKTTASLSDAPSRGARLKLAPIDLSVELSPSLTMSDVMQLTVTEDATKRAAAVAMWHALNVSAEDALRDAARIRAMEASLQELKAQTAKNTETATALSDRLDHSGGHRTGGVLVYVLAFLLAVCVGLLVLAYRRMRDTGAVVSPWWRDVSADEVAASWVSTGSSKEVPSSGGTAHTEPRDSLDIHSNPAASVSPVDIDLQLSESAFADLGKPAPVVGVAAKTVTLVERPQDEDSKPSFAHSVNSVWREINTEEMLDVRQQADFFLALGQYEEAIDVLKASIVQSNESNPLVYLDLIKVYHKLSQKAEFHHYRQQFNFLFSGCVPEYSDFNYPGNSLDAYPEVCQRVVALWPGQEALEYIERCLVRDPDGDPRQGFDLDAFMELLLLHGVVKRIISSSDSDFVTFSTGKPQIESAVGLSHATSSQKAISTTSVDLDLSEPTANLLDFDSTNFNQPKPATSMGS